MKPAQTAVFISFAFLVGIALGLFGPSMLSPDAPVIDTSHDHSSHMHGDAVSVSAGADAPTLDFMVMKDPASGWNLRILTSNFRFAPDHASQQNAPGEGHAHIYVNGEKLARVYGEWFHISDLPAGASVMVGLYANDHSMLAVEGQHLSVTKTVP